MLVHNMATLVDLPNGVFIGSRCGDQEDQWCDKHSERVDDPQIKTWWRSRTSWFPPIGSASRTYIYIWCTSWWKPILIGLSKLPTICPTIFAHILCFSYVFCTIHVNLSDFFCENAAAQGSWTSTFLHRDLNQQISSSTPTATSGCRWRKTWARSTAPQPTCGLWAASYKQRFLVGNQPFPENATPVNSGESFVLSEARLKLIWTSLISQETRRSCNRSFRMGCRFLLSTQMLIL